MTKTVYILCGIEGSGKTTAAKKLATEDPGATTRIVSADDYMVNDRGEREFDPKRLSENHGKCQAAFHDAIKQGIERIIVDNTNLVASHRDIYVSHALQNGYDVVTMVFDTSIETAAARNVHGVPLHTLEMQRKKLDLEPGIYTLGFTPVGRVAA